METREIKDILKDIKYEINREHMPDTESKAEMDARNATLVDNMLIKYLPTKGKRTKARKKRKV